MNILILQKDTHKAGAQTALYRICKVLKDKARIIVICSNEGWLTQSIEKIDIDFVILKFPSSRAFFAKIYKNKEWAKNIANILTDKNFIPDVIFGNDYTESILLSELHVLYGKAKSIILLRNAYICKKDFDKYQCDRHNHIFAVSQISLEIFQQYTNKKIEVFSDFLLEEEFHEPKQKPMKFPNKILLIGAPTKRKGWDIAFKAFLDLDELFQNYSLEIDCTGIPNKDEMALFQPIINKVKNIKINFLEKFENLGLESREYDLAIFASRSETFGLAPLEVIAAGVPVICSNVGVLGDVINDDKFIFEVEDKSKLSKNIKYIFQNWDDIECKISEKQNKIKNKFLFIFYKSIFYFFQ